MLIMMFEISMLEWLMALLHRFHITWCSWLESNSISSVSGFIFIVNWYACSFWFTINSSLKCSSHGCSWTTSGVPRCCLDSCSTFSTMLLRRLAWELMIPVNFFSEASFVVSPSSWPAWLMADSGLRISCAILAVRRPSEASFYLLETLC